MTRGVQDPFGVGLVPALAAKKGYVMSEWTECDKPEHAPNVTVCSVCGSKNFKWVRNLTATQFRAECRSCGHRSQALPHSENQKKFKKRPDQREWALAVIRNANGICQICHEAPAEEAHHIMSVATGEKIGAPAHMIWALSNGIACCRSCHRKVHEASFDTERKVHFSGKNKS